MLTDLIIFFIMETNPYLQRCRIRSVTRHTLFNRVLHIVFTQFEIHKFKAQLSAIILDR